MREAEKKAKEMREAKEKEAQEMREAKEEEAKERRAAEEKKAEDMNAAKNQARDELKVGKDDDNKRKQPDDNPMKQKKFRVSPLGSHFTNAITQMTFKQVLSISKQLRKDVGKRWHAELDNWLLHLEDSAFRVIYDEGKSDPRISDYEKYVTEENGEK